MPDESTCEGKNAVTQWVKTHDTVFSLQSCSDATKHRDQQCEARGWPAKSHNFRGSSKSRHTMFLSLYQTRSANNHDSHVGGIRALKPSYGNVDTAVQVEDLLTIFND